jgi:hypothetical protein
VPAEPSLDIEAILRALAGHGVEYIVVGRVVLAILRRILEDQSRG